MEEPDTGEAGKSVTGKKGENVAVANENITERLVAFCSDLSFSDLPIPVVQRARYALLDFLGLAVRGSIEPSSRVVQALVRDLGAKGTATAIGIQSKYAPQYAALANGAAAHALELDDLHHGGSVHIGVAVCPAALAAAEMSGIPDEELITAIVVGYEIAARLGQALNPKEHYARGFHPTGTCGVMAATATAAKVFGLSKEQTASALGISGSFAAGSMQFLEDTGETWIKRLHPGWAAHSGILAAKLAEKGFKGPSRIVEGKYGFLRAYSNHIREEVMLQRLGRSYDLMSTGIKLHACCGYEHAPIDGILSIVADNDLGPDEIESVEIRLVSTAFPIVVEPEELRYNPRTVTEAQYSLPFGAALAIVKRAGSLDQYSQENVDSPIIQRIARRVRCHRDPALDQALPDKWPAVVTIETSDGRRFVRQVDYPKGDAQNPASDEEIVAKFESLTRGILSLAAQEEIVRLISNMPDGNTLAHLVQGLRAAART